MRVAFRVSTRSRDCRDQLGSRGKMAAVRTAGIRTAPALPNTVSHIQLHSHGKLNIETLARQHGLSTTHFRKLFREYYRQSPRSAHLNAKMRAACDCLVYSDLNITEIADRLGFTNVHNFSRAFSKAIGQSPSAYRAGKIPLP